MQINLHQNKKYTVNKYINNLDLQKGLRNQ